MIRFISPATRAGLILAKFEGASIDVVKVFDTPQLSNIFHFR